MTEPFSHPVFKTEDEFLDRAREVWTEEQAAGEYGWYWLSFVDTTQPYREEDDYPGGPRWLGGCFVQAWGTGTAAAEAHLRGCNPGGEVACWGPCPVAPREGYQNRLLTTLDEVAASDPEAN